jgi:hypothetical protein
VLRRREGTCFSFPSDDEVGGFPRAIRAERAQRVEQSDTRERHRDVVFTSLRISPIDQRDRQGKRV